MAECARGIEQVNPVCGREIKAVIWSQLQCEQILSALLYFSKAQSVPVTSDEESSGPLVSGIDGKAWGIK